MGEYSRKFYRKINIEVDIKKLIQVNPLLWASYAGGGIKLDTGERYKLKGYKYQNYLLDHGRRCFNVKKGTQIGATLVYQFDVIHGLIYKRYPRGVMYMMPDKVTVEKFSQLRFTPMFEANPTLSQHLERKVSNMSQKIINGGSLIFVGARSTSVGDGSSQDSSSLRIFAIDYIVRDEIDLHDPKMVEQSKQRLNSSKIRKEVNLGSPTYPGHGIDVLYENSSQGRIETLCESCGKYTCLERDFPTCIELRDGHWTRVCTHCKKPLNVNNNVFVEDYPDRSEGGVWLSTFQSPVAEVAAPDGSTLLDSLMDRYHRAEGSDMCEWMRSVLGVATIEADNQVSMQDVYDNCDPGQAMQNVSSAETIMGVDVGKTLHCVVGQKLGNDSYKILHVESIPIELGFDRLHDIAQAMNVRMCVIDANPDTHATTEFQKHEPYPVYRCFYSEQMPGPAAFDPKTGNVKVNRNQWMDKVHSVLTSKGKIVLPRRCPPIDEYALQMTMTVKTTEENKKTGQKRPLWKKLSSGNDHFFHATLYFLLGASVSPATRDIKDRQRYTKTKCSIKL